MSLLLPATASLVLLMLPPSGLAAAPSLSTEETAVVEVVIRHVAPQYCATPEHYCCLSVFEVTPPGTLLDRLGDLPRVRPYGPDLLTPCPSDDDGRATDLDVRSVSVDEHGSSVVLFEGLLDIGVGFYCTYSLRRVADKWELRKSEITCVGTPI